MTFPFRVHLHLGAHKTASTFIQSWLGSHQSFLREHQIAYIPLDKLRQGFTVMFADLVNGKLPETTESIEKICSEIKSGIDSTGGSINSTKLLVLSEENILGGTGSLSFKGVLYPDLARRIHCLSLIFSGCEVKTFLSIRNYREFYPSAYAETLRSGHIKPFETFINGLDLSGNSWIHVIDTLESSFAKTQLWTYEQFRENAHHIISALLDIQVTSDMVSQQVTVRRSLTQKGLNMVMQCKDSLSPPELKRLINLLSDKMVFDKPDHPITFTDSAIGEQLSRQYENEVRKMADQLIIQ